jgi:hypothetical protein
MLSSISKLLLILAIISVLIGLTVLVLGEPILERIEEFVAGGTTELIQPEVIQPTLGMENAERSTDSTATPSPEVGLENAPDPHRSILGGDVTYVRFNRLGEVYPTEGIFDVQQGTFALWMNFPRDHPQRDYSIFHTDDSRFVLYIDSYTSSEEIVRIAARAGGNQRAIDSEYALGNFPEASIIIDNDGSLSEYGANVTWTASRAYPDDEWHHVAMTWEGYPFGSVRIFMDGLLVAEKPYDPRYGDGQPLPNSLAIGFRPAFSTGELVDGVGDESLGYTPDTYMQMDMEAPSVGDILLYNTALSSEQIIRIMMELEPEE